MTIDEAAAMAEWAREQRSENPNSAFGRIKIEAVADVVRAMTQELPSAATPQERYDWVILHEATKPDRFRGIYHRADLWKLTASEKLGVANGEKFPPSKSPRPGAVKKGRGGK